MSERVVGEQFTPSLAPGQHSRRQRRYAAVTGKPQQDHLAMRRALHAVFRVKRKLGWEQARDERANRVAA